MWREYALGKEKIKRAQFWPQGQQQCCCSNMHTCMAHMHTWPNVQYNRSCVPVSPHIKVHMHSRGLVIPWCFLHIQKGPWPPPPPPPLSCSIKETEQNADLSQSFCISISETEREHLSREVFVKCSLTPIFCYLWKNGWYDRRVVN